MTEKRVVKIDFSSMEWLGSPYPTNNNELYRDKDGQEYLVVRNPDCKIIFKYPQCVNRGYDVCNCGMSFIRDFVLKNRKYYRDFVYGYAGVKYR